MAVAGHDPQDALGFKVPWIHEGGQSSTSTTWRDLSDRTLITPSRASPCEATPICRAPSAETSVDTVVVVVLRHSRGVVIGKLQCGTEEPHEVVFTLLQLKPSYNIVCDVLEGPEPFERVCWKLRSVSGCSDVDPAWIGKGDVLVLEGPRWATQRVSRAASVDLCDNKNLVRDPEVASADDHVGVPVRPVDAYAAGDESDGEATSHAIIAAITSSAEFDEWRAASGPSLQGDTIAKTMPRVQPTVPRLNLDVIHSPQEAGPPEESRSRFATFETYLCRDVTSSHCRPGGNLDQCSTM